MVRKLCTKARLKPNKVNTKFLSSMPYAKGLDVSAIPAMLTTRFFSLDWFSSLYAALLGRHPTTPQHPGIFDAIQVSHSQLYTVASGPPYRDFLLQQFSLTAEEEFTSLDHCSLLDTKVRAIKPVQLSVDTCLGCNLGPHPSLVAFETFLCSI